MTMTGQRQIAAQLVRQILLAVEQGELDADSPAARRLLRRPEGAAVGLAVDPDLPVADTDGFGSGTRTNRAKQRTEGG